MASASAGEALRTARDMSPPRRRHYGQLGALMKPIVPVLPPLSTQLPPPAVLPVEPARIVALDNRTLVTAPSMLLPATVALATSIVRPTDPVPLLAPVIVLLRIWTLLELPSTSTPRD